MRSRRFKLLTALAAAGLILMACSTAEPAQPTQEPTPPPTIAATSQDTAEPEPSEEPTQAPTEAIPEPTAPAGTFTILPAESEARFLINEVLLGQEKTVVGTTREVTGAITPDFDNPGNTSVSTFTVDLSTLRTDDSNRTRAVHNRILETTNEAFRFAVFEPTALSGLPEAITIGEPFSFQITGDLTIHGVTLEKTFDVTANAVSQSRIEGLARLRISYPEFDVQILRLPQAVASVERQVILELEFVAEERQ